MSEILSCVSFYFLCKISHNLINSFDLSITTVSSSILSLFIDLKPHIIAVSTTSGVVNVDKASVELRKRGKELLKYINIIYKP